MLPSVLKASLCISQHWKSGIDAYDVNGNSTAIIKHLILYPIISTYYAVSNLKNFLVCTTAMIKHPIAKHALNPPSPLPMYMILVIIMLTMIKGIYQYRIKYMPENTRHITVLLLISNNFAVILVSGENNIAKKPATTVKRNIAIIINGILAGTTSLTLTIIIAPVIAVIKPPIKSSFVPSNISEILSTVIFILLFIFHLHVL